MALANFSDRPVSSIGLKIELQTDRREHRVEHPRGHSHATVQRARWPQPAARCRNRTALLDIGAAPLAALAAGSRHDVIVECDLKELGAHTLVCSSAYTDADGERKYLPQYFRFAVTNPLSVRTKARAAGVATTRASAAETFPLKDPAKRVHPCSGARSARSPGAGRCSSAASRTPPRTRCWWSLFVLSLRRTSAAPRSRRPQLPQLQRGHTLRRAAPPPRPAMQTP